MGKKHYSKQWCGVTQQTHEKEQGIKMHPHYFYTCTQKENLQKFFFNDRIRIRYRFSRIHLLLRRLPFCCYRFSHYCDVYCL